MAAIEVLEGVHSDECEAVYEELWGPADRFVREHWPLISAVGEALLQRGRLTGREVREIVEAAKLQGACSETRSPNDIPKRRRAVTTTNDVELWTRLRGSSIPIAITQATSV